MKIRDEMPLVEMAYDFCLAGNEMDAARILRMLLDRHKQAPPRLTKGEVKLIVKRRMQGYEERQKQRVERRAVVRAAGLREREIGYPKESLIRRQLVYQEAQCD